MHEGTLNKELLKGFSTLLLDVKLILKSLVVLKGPRKAISAVGAPGRKNCWQCEIPSPWHHPPGDKTQVQVGARRLRKQLLLSLSCFSIRVQHWYLQHRAVQQSSALSEGLPCSQDL